MMTPTDPSPSERGSPVAALVSNQVPVAGLGVPPRMQRDVPLNGKSLQPDSEKPLCVPISPLAECFSSRLRSTFADVTLGGAVVEANGYERADAPIVVLQNFIPSLREPGGMPLQIAPEPDYDKCTNHLSVPSLGPNEVALTTPLPEGLIEYYMDRGLLSSGDKVVSVSVDDSSLACRGFPHFDPLSLAVSEKTDLGKGFFVSAFTSRFVRSQAEQLGLTPVQMSDSFITNDKVGFGMWAEYFGYTPCPRVVVKSVSDVERAAQQFKNSPVWVKFSHAFGGDLLFKCEPPLRPTEILGCIERMYKAVSIASQVNQYGGVSLDELWPPGDVAPRCGGIVIEQDARYMGSRTSPGTILCTGSNLMEVRNDGSSIVRGYFEQIMGPAGEFLGSAAFDPMERFGPSMKGELDRQFDAIGRYCDEKLQLRGLVGVDFMIIEDSNGDVRPVMVELNGRPPVSAFSHIVGTQKLKAPYWISRYVWAHNYVESASDFEELVTVGRTNYARSSWMTGAVIPMCLSTVSTHGSHGKNRVVSPSERAQVLVVGESKSHCEEILGVLSKNNRIRFSPK